MGDIDTPVKVEATEEEIYDTPEYVFENDIATNMKEEPPDEKLPAKNKQTFYCSYCPKKYPKVEYLHIHEYIHNPEKSCPFCYTIFDKKNLIKHMNGHIKEKIDEDRRKQAHCDICNKSFTCKKSAVIHSRVHTNERPYKCQLCGKGFKQSGSLKVHNITHTKVKAFSCTVCSGTFVTASALRRHIRNIHEAGKTYICKDCDIKFPNITKLNVHRKEIHPRQKTDIRRCPVCPMVFKSQMKLYEHKEMHRFKNEVSQSKYVCILCGERFLNFKVLTRHRYNHMQYNTEDLQAGRARGSYSCKLCTREFVERNGLFRHMNFHMEKNVKCEICKEYFSYYGYELHKKIAHQTSRCNVCRQYFKGTKQLTLHKQTVHGIQVSKRFTCHECGKGFLYKHLLLSHMNVTHNFPHKLEKHQCAICGKECSSKGTLGLHLARVHPAKARIKCDYCKVSFYMRKELSRHNYIHHSGVTVERKMYHCKDCNKELDGWTQFKLHRRNEHKAVIKRNFSVQCKMCFRFFQNKKNHQRHIDAKVCSKFFEKINKNVYTCPVCCQEFFYRFAFFNHMIVHQKFYRQCRFCGKKFRMIRHMGLHMTNEHPGEKLYYCGYCEVAFDSNTELRTHRSSLGHVQRIEQECAIEESKQDVKVDTRVEIVPKEEIKEEPED